MPLEDILNKIRDESSQAAQAIIDDAEARAKKRLDEARAEAQSKAAAILGEAKTQAAKVEAMAKTRADAGRRQALLKEKQTLIDGAFAKAADNLSALPSEEYREMMLRSLREAAVGGETVVFGPEDKARLGDGFADELNRALSADKKPTVICEFADKSLGGGYILRSGGVSQNVTFPALIKRFADELEIEAARRLFSES